MGIIKTAAAMTAAATGTLYAAGKLATMDSEDIRGIGGKVSGFVHECGGKFADSAIGRDIYEKIETNPYASKVFQIASIGAETGLSGFSAFMDTVADARAKSELDGSDFAGNLVGGITGSLKGLIAEGTDFVSEKLQAGQESGVEAANRAAEYQAVQEINDGYEFM